jgi:hypothetical protein
MVRLNIYCRPRISYEISFDPIIRQAAVKSGGSQPQVSRTMLALGIILLFMLVPVNDAGWRDSSRPFCPGSE